MIINPNKCVACGNCTYVCTMGAIYIDPVIKRATVDNDECVECYACFNGMSQEHLNPTLVRTLRRIFQMMRLRFDPRVAALMAAELARDNRMRLEHVLGRPASPAETYLAHFLGLRQAARMIDAAATRPATAAARLVPAAAASNPAVLGRASASAVVHAVEAYFRDEVPRFAAA